MPDRALLPRTLRLLALTGKPRGSVPPRDTEPVAYEEAAGVLEEALHQATRDPSLLPQLSEALERMGRDAGGR